MKDKWTYGAILPPPDAMIDHFHGFFVKNRLPKNLVCDHICYRVETTGRYEEIKTALCAAAELVAETMVAGRPICIFRISEPYRGIDCIELPAPKAGSFYREGWEHAEFVITQDFDDFMSAYPGPQFDTKDMNKASNPDISLDAGDGFRIKFHHAHILDVIARERLSSCVR